MLWSLWVELYELYFILTREYLNAPPEGGSEQTSEIYGPSVQKREIKISLYI